MIDQPKVGMVVVRNELNWTYQDQDCNNGKPVAGTIISVEHEVNVEQFFSREHLGPASRHYSLLGEKPRWIRVKWHHPGNGNAYPPWSLDELSLVTNLVTTPTEIKEFEEV